MKIKKFNENNSEDNKYYVYQVHPSDRTHRGSIWDDDGPWIPDDSKLVCEFEIIPSRTYMIVSQEELDEINEIKLQRKVDEETKKFNL